MIAFLFVVTVIAGLIVFLSTYEDFACNFTFRLLIEMFHCFNINVLTCRRSDFSKVV